jgi:hypothetical protein
MFVPSAVAPSTLLPLDSPQAAIASQPSTLSIRYLNYPDSKVYSSCAERKRCPGVAPFLVAFVDSWDFSALAPVVGEHSTLPEEDGLCSKRSSFLIILLDSSHLLSKASSLSELEHRHRRRRHSAGISGSRPTLLSIPRRVG